jgi:hypothetical protein
MENRQHDFLLVASAKFHRNFMVRNNSQPQPIVPVIMLFAGLIGFMLALFGGYNAVKNRQARAWPIVDGSVISSKIIRVDSGPRLASTVPKAEVRYKYEVNDQPFESENLYFGEMQIGGTRQLFPTKCADEYPVGRAVRVAYNPADPTDAVLVSNFAMNALWYFALGIWLMIAYAYYVFRPNGSFRAALKAKRASVVSQRIMNCDQ